MERFLLVQMFRGVLCVSMSTENGHRSYLKVEELVGRLFEDEGDCTSINYAFLSLMQSVLASPLASYKSWAVVSHLDEDCRGVVSVYHYDSFDVQILPYSVDCQDDFLTK